MNWCSLTLQLAILGSGVIIVSPSWGPHGPTLSKPFPWEVECWSAVAAVVLIIKTQPGSQPGIPVF